MNITNMLDVVKELDSRITTYTDETSADARIKVVDSNNNEGVIVGYNVKNPSGKNKGHIVKWKRTGEMKWYSEKDLNSDSGDIKLVKPTIEDFLISFIKY